MLKLVEQQLQIFEAVSTRDWNKNGSVDVVELFTQNSNVQKNREDKKKYFHKVRHEFLIK